MGEVGQQSDSVSDRSCHHAALTGFTIYFGNSKYTHALSPILQAEEDTLFSMVKIYKISTAREMQKSKCIRGKSLQM